MSPSEFARKTDELLERLPLEFRGAVGHMAWEMGHSSGYDEVINYLRGFVSDLDAPCQNFERRIRESL